jgi:hypothetical protein
MIEDGRWTLPEEEEEEVWMDGKWNYREDWANEGEDTALTAALNKLNKSEPKWTAEERGFVVRWIDESTS